MYLFVLGNASGGYLQGTCCRPRSGNAPIWGPPYSLLFTAVLTSLFPLVPITARGPYTVRRVAALDVTATLIGAQSAGTRESNQIIITDRPQQNVTPP